MNYIDSDQWSKTEPDDPASQIIHLLRRIAFAYAEHVSRAATELDLHPTDLRTLAAILDATREGTVLTTGNLARQLPINQPAVTAVVDRLVTKGLVERVRVPGDRRKIGLVVTSEGRAKGWEAFAPLIEDLHGNLSTAPPAKLSNTRNVLQRALDTLSDGAS